jgi:chemotaxis family two-component system response regulator PixH
MATGLRASKGLMPQKILIVEDNPDLSDLLAISLRAEGYEISLAGNSAQGINKALCDRPDLIITDLLLPDMTAVDAAHELKRNPATARIPIIVLTAMMIGDWKARALKAGVAEYLIKPISRPDLLRVVHKLIQSPSLLTER